MMFKPAPVLPQQPTGARIRSRLCPRQDLQTANSLDATQNLIQTQNGGAPDVFFSKVGHTLLRVNLGEPLGVSRYQQTLGTVTLHVLGDVLFKIGCSEGSSRLQVRGSLQHLKGHCRIRGCNIPDSIQA